MTTLRDSAARLDDVLAALLVLLQHEQRRLLQVDLDLDQRSALVLEQPQLLRAVVQNLICPFCQTETGTLMH
jgi:hypothetical protein